MPGVEAARGAGDDDVQARVRQVDGGDGCQVGVCQLVQQLPGACVHDVHRVQGNAPNILTDIPSTPRAKYQYPAPIKHTIVS